MNKVILIGRLTKDIDLKSTTAGVMVTSFDIAVKQEFKNSDGEYGTDFFKCTVFRGGAEYLSNYAKKGTLISVEGRLKNNSWEKDGEKRYSTEIICESVKVLSSGKNSSSDVTMPAEFTADEDDLPY